MNQYSNYAILLSVDTVMKQTIKGPVLTSPLMAGKSTGSEGIWGGGEASAPKRQRWNQLTLAHHK